MTNTERAENFNWFVKHSVTHLWGDETTTLSDTVAMISKMADLCKYELSEESLNGHADQTYTYLQDLIAWRRLTN